MLYKLHSSLNTLQAVLAGAHLVFLRAARWDKVSLRTARSEPAEVIWAAGSLGLCSC